MNDFAVAVVVCLGGFVFAISGLSFESMRKDYMVMVEGERERGEFESQDLDLEDGKPLFYGLREWSKSWFAIMGGWTLKKLKNNNKINFRISLVFFFNF